MDRTTLLRLLAEKAGDSPWRDIGREALKTAVNTLIEEGIEATVEIWKKRRLKIQEEYLEQRSREDEEMADTGVDRERKDYPDGGEVEEDDEAVREEAEAARRPGRSSIETFGSYVRRKP